MRITRSSVQLNDERRVYIASLLYYICIVNRLLSIVDLRCFDTDKFYKIMKSCLEKNAFWRAH